MKVLNITFFIGALTLGGCTQSPKTIDYSLVATNITPHDYAQVLCYGVPMDERHTCMTRAMQHYRERVRLDGSPAEATDGPFAMVFSNGEFYSGRYVSEPFSSAFTVRNAQGAHCRGRYSAYQGDQKPIFTIRCDNGATGQGNIILDLGGRNGLGEFKLDDGRRGRIAFGYAAVDLGSVND